MLWRWPKDAGTPLQNIGLPTANAMGPQVRITSPSRLLVYRVTPAESGIALLLPGVYLT